jgi:diaminopimelate epimerase
MTIRFTKMEGIGNDYVYVNGFEQRVDDPVNVAKKIADRHFGVGGDGLILVLPPEKGVDADVRMRMFNADGSESEMCGNGVRCVCKLAHDRGISKANPMRVQTGRGVLSLSYTTDGDGTVDRVTVDMGEPILEDEDIPVRTDELSNLEAMIAKLCGSNVSTRVRTGVHSGRISETASFTGEGFVEGLIYRCVSMGNPHIVIYVNDVQAVQLDRIGPLIEFHDAFPKRVNAHFVQVNWRGEVTMRTWERGSGVTLACGTGAAAVCVAGVLAGVTDREILAHLPGGDLTLRWRENNHVFKTGPAREVFTGEWCG